MALCLAIANNGTLMADGQYDPAFPCELVAMTASEFTNAADFALVFGAPEPEQVVSAFMAGIGLPLTLWLVAWGFGMAIRFATQN